MQPCRLPCAVACISGGKEHPKLQGVLRFSQHCGGVLVTVEVSGFPCDGFYVLQIHEVSSCKKKALCQGDHHHETYGKLPPNHSGALPPLLACKGRARMSVLTGRFRVDEIIGKTVSINECSDDPVIRSSVRERESVAWGIICAEGRGNRQCH